VADILPALRLGIRIAAVIPLEKIKAVSKETALIRVSGSNEVTICPRLIVVLVVKFVHSLSGLSHGGFIIDQAAALAEHNCAS
jgi:hypothetical protein